MKHKKPLEVSTLTGSLRQSHKKEPRTKALTEFKVRTEMSHQWSRDRRAARTKTRGEKEHVFLHEHALLTKSRFNDQLT
jgi:hypothetical protein